jgi:hypothetical protein
MAPKRHRRGGGRRAWSLRAIGAALLLAGGAEPLRADEPASDSALIPAVLLRVPAPGAAEVLVRLPDPLGQQTLAVSETTARDRLVAATEGDIVQLRLDPSARPLRITAIAHVVRPVPLPARLFALAAGFAVLTALAWQVAGGNPKRFMVGLDGRYSNSQTQFVLWSAALGTVYLATLMLRGFYLGALFCGGIGLTGNLIALAGLSAFSFGGARAITSSKAESATAEQKLLKHDPQRPPQPDLLRDLMRNDAGQPDFGDFQMMLVTLSAMAIFAVSAFNWLGTLALEATVTLPDVDTALLSAFGVGQGAYLFKKAASNFSEG